MIKTSLHQKGSAHIVIIILVVTIAGVLGFVFWQKFIQSPPDTQVSQGKPPEKVDPLCAGDAIEQDGIFCSKSIGVKFKIPEVFVGKFQKKENYDVYQGPMESAKGNLDGKSLEYYEAAITSGNETLSLSVAKEPLRTGYSSIGHALQRTYFDASSGDLYLVKGPSLKYDSATDTTKTIGGWSAGELVPSFKIGETKVYYGTVGDVGVSEGGYLMVVDSYLVIIEIKHSANPMETPVLDGEKSFMDLNSNIKQLKVLK
jgi:hypothetical protein